MKLMREFPCCDECECLMAAHLCDAFEDATDAESPVEVCKRCDRTQCGGREVE
jgi:hypothetical protein